jgi:hypothetical protein
LPWLPWNINNPNPQFSKAYLIALNLNNFKTIEAIGLKIIASWSLEWHYLHTKFHQNLPCGSTVISGDTQISDLISLLSFLKSGLKMNTTVQLAGS